MGESPLSAGDREPASARLFEPGTEVTIRAKVVESLLGDTCINVMVGDRRMTQSFWVPTEMVEEVPVTNS